MGDRRRNPCQGSRRRHDPRNRRSRRPKALRATLGPAGSRSPERPRPGGVYRSPGCRRTSDRHPRCGGVCRITVADHGSAERQSTRWRSNSSRPPARPARGIPHQLHLRQVEGAFPARGVPEHFVEPAGVGFIPQPESAGSRALSKVGFEERHAGPLGSSWSMRATYSALDVLSSRAIPAAAASNSGPEAA